jgi:hypothetical protein
MESMTLRIETKTAGRKQNTQLNGGLRGITV